jgi:hypothetical protein
MENLAVYRVRFNAEATAMAKSDQHRAAAKEVNAAPLVAPETSTPQ